MVLQFSIVTITAFVAALNECVKYISKSIFKKDMNAYIPIFSLVFGIILGIAGYFTNNVDMGNNLIEAIFIGLAAGATATDIHQVGKQLIKANNDESSEENKKE